MAERCRFFGLPIFRRLPGSVIQIAAGCEFRSAAWSNMAGINRPCVVSTLSEQASIEIGHSCGFSGTVMGAAASIRLGERVMCGANVTITDTDWHPIQADLRAQHREGDSAPVVINDDVWLGMGVVVLKGVVIGPRTVVAAGSIVTRSLPGDVIAAGQPARVVRRLAGTSGDCSVPTTAAQFLT